MRRRPPVYFLCCGVDSSSTHNTHTHTQRLNREANFFVLKSLLGGCVVVVMDFTHCGDVQVWLFLLLLSMMTKRSNAGKSLSWE